MMRTGRNPPLPAVFFGAVLTGVVGVVAIVETESWWVMGLAVAALILLLLALVLDVATIDGQSSYRLARRPHRQPPPASRPERPGLDYRGPAARHRLLVMTSEPLSSDRVLQAMRRSEPAVAPAELGVMVVSPEGFGRPEITNDEGHYEAARQAEGETVASLRRASVKAAGHVGDHDATQAVADALALFPAQRVLVFATPEYADAYKRAIEADAVRPPLEIVELAA
jgi:hypothetical protein